MPTSDAVFAERVAESYDRHMVPMLFAPYAAEVVPRMAWLTQGHLLETAAGTGIVTAALAEALPQAVAITATDLNQPMLDRAARRLPAGRVTLRQADAQRLPFEDGAFDAVVCQFGIMFMPERQAAFAEMFRVLRPGGRFLLSVWSTLARNPIPQAVQDGVSALFPTDPPLFMARTPHGHDDIPGITAALEAAGFLEVRAERSEVPCRAHSAREAATAICQGTPLRVEIEARGPPDLQAATQAAAQAVADRFGTGDVDAPAEAPMEAIFFTGRKPG